MSREYHGCHFEIPEKLLFIIIIIKYYNNYYIVLLSVGMSEDSLATDSQPDIPEASGDSWGLPEITGRGIIPMASEEELEELQDMVDELLNSDGNEGQPGQGMS